MKTIRRTPIALTLALTAPFAPLACSGTAVTLGDDFLADSGGGGGDDASLGSEAASANEASGGQDTGAPALDGSGGGNADGGGNSDANSDANSGGDADSGGSSDATSGSDAWIGADAHGNTPDGGAVSDPGLVSCGSSACTVGSQTCCTRADGGASCASTGGGACPGAFIKSACNEAADCPGGDVCCMESTLNGFATRCRHQCTAQYPGQFFTQICRTNSECSGVSCVVQACRGIPIESCGGFSGGIFCQ